MKKESEGEKLDDIEFLKAEVEKLKKHLAKNKKDYKTKRALLIKEARLHRLREYKGRKKEK